MQIYTHVIIASIYAMAGILVGILGYRFGGISFNFAVILALGVALFAGQIHIWMIISLDSGKRRLKTDMGAMQVEIHKTRARMTVIELKIGDILERIEYEVHERRQVIASEMRELEGLISKLGVHFENKLRADEHAKAMAAQTPKMTDLALRLVKDALAKNRVELHLQPVVNLPQRRICFYEGFTRLKTEDGRLIMPGEFLDAAEQAGLLGLIDNMLLFRCIQIIRRLSHQNRQIGIFCNVAPASFEDDVFFPQFLDFLKQHKDLTNLLIFELSAENFKMRSQKMEKNMARLAEIGFKFSLDKARNLNLDLQELQNNAICFFKIEGDLLLRELSSMGSRSVSSLLKDIKASDVPSMFARYDISLIVEKMEDERTVIEILEFDIPFGQGHIFGAPKPVREELLDDTAPPENFLQHKALAS